MKKIIDKYIEDTGGLSMTYILKFARALIQTNLNFINRYLN